MGVPGYETLMRPTLAALASGQPQTRSQIHDAVAQATGISGDDLEAMLPSGKATVFGGRVGWALTYMSQAGLATRPKRGVYVITDRGLKVLGEQPDRVDSRVLEQFPEFLDFRARRNEKGEPTGTHGAAASEGVAALSPTEAIERLVSDADDAVASELLDRVLAQSPAFLERLSLRLLRAMGYGGREALLSDFDWVARGPREWDLAPTAVAAERFGLPDADYAAFVRAYGRDVVMWEGYSTLRAVREVTMTTWLMQNVLENPHVAAEFRLRVKCLREGDHDQPWRAF